VGPMKIEKIGHDTIQCRRAARRAGLNYHIDPYGYVDEGGDESEEQRRATDFELSMWSRLVPPEFVPQWPLQTPLPSLDATLEEFQNVYPHSPMTFNAEDFAVLRRYGDKLGVLPVLDRALLHRGLVAYWEGFPVYVSRLIPKGYYWKGALETWRPPEGERVLNPGIDDQLAFKINRELSDLMVY
jgi:hypothetical protein